MRDKFIITPFGNAGDLTAIPDPTQLDGSVSANQGWGVDYQRDQLTDPLAKDIDRKTMNWLFNAITTLLRRWQTETWPEFISTADNGGAPYSYAQGVTIRYRASDVSPFFTYTSLVDSNTSLPTDATKWRVVDVFVSANQFAASFGTSGYQKLSSGFILQWGRVVTVAGGGSLGAVGATVSFPIAFPANLYGVFPSVTQTSTTTISAWYDNDVLSGMRISTSGIAGTIVYYIAIGK